MGLLVPQTSTVTTHGLQLISGSGKVVGGITSWSTRQARTLKPVFELGQVSQGGGDDVLAETGECYEVVPGNSSGTTIAIRRYELYLDRFEQAWGTRDLTMLTRQNASIRLREAWSTPGTTPTFGRIYFGCFFQDLGRESSAEGDRVSMVSATLMYARVRPST